MAEIQATPSDAAQTGAAGKGKGRARKPALAFGVDHYPNPANPSTTITCTLAAAAEVDLVIYNLLGPEVRELVKGPGGPGMRTVRWDGRDAQGRQATSGVYLCRLQAGENVATRRIILAR